MPTRTTRPARAMVETASQVARAFPEHSSSTSGSTPASAIEVWLTSTVPKPSFSARRSRCGFTSVTVTASAPYARAVCAAISPIGPAPVTSTVQPGTTWVRRHAQTPTESGSSRPAAVADGVRGRVDECGRYHHELAERAVVGRSGEESDVRAEVVAACEALPAETAGHPRFDRNPLSHTQRGDLGAHGRHDAAGLVSKY